MSCTRRVYHNDNPTEELVVFFNNKKLGVTLNKKFIEAPIEYSVLEIDNLFCCVCLEYLYGSSVFLRQQDSRRKTGVRT